jgi:DNA-binding PadR family transcriptional regulator
MENCEGYVGSIYERLKTEGLLMHVSQIRRAVKSLVDAGVLRFKRRGPAERGGKRKYYEPTYLGWELNQYVGEMESLIRRKPSHRASKKEIGECLEMLKSKIKYKQRVGAKRLYNLALRKDVLHDKRVIEFLTKVLEDPNYDHLSIGILLPLDEIVRRLPSRKLTEIETGGLKRHCLVGEDSTETLVSFTILRLIDEDEALDVIPRMITELNDQQFPDYERWALEIRKLSIDRRRKLRLKLFNLTKEDPREKVQERSQRIQSISLWIE